MLSLNDSKALQCPVIGSHLLYDAVVLTPCGHKISELAIKTFFQDQYRNFIMRPCPVCKIKVTSYSPAPNESTFGVGRSRRYRGKIFQSY